MRIRTGFVLFLGAISMASLDQRPLLAQACHDEEGMVGDYKKSITDLAATAKKESVEEFDRAYHRKSCLTKLTLCLGILDGTMDCLDKAAHDPAATKDQTEAYKAKRDSYSKLKEKVGQYRDALKAAEASKAAKALIEKFDLAN